MQQQGGGGASQESAGGWPEVVNLRKEKKYIECFFAIFFVFTLLEFFEASQNLEVVFSAASPWTLMLDASTGSSAFVVACGGSGGGLVDSILTLSFFPDLSNVSSCKLNRFRSYYIIRWTWTRR